MCQSIDTFYCKGNGMIDKEGYRPNVGIVLLHKQGTIFWGKRVGKFSWQFPQGGIEHGESPLQAMFRELYEEVGLRPEHVQYIGRTRDWLRYNVPTISQRGRYRGQKQIWFLVRLQAEEKDIDLNVTSHPEFDGWRWEIYGKSLDTVIEFKREVYRKALIELAAFLPSHYVNKLLYK